MNSPGESSAGSMGWTSTVPSAMQFGRDQARKHLHAAGLDLVVVVARPDRPAAHLGDAQAAPVAAEIRCQQVEADHTVDDRVHMQALLADLAFV